MCPQNRVTIKEVAKIAGVSTQTVSRVLNNRPDVSDHTRRRIQQIIDDVGYSPNVYARNLSRGRSNTIGVIGFGLNYFGTQNVLSGIEKEANNLDYTLSLRLIDRFNPTRVNEIIYNLESERVEGLIWAVPGGISSSDWLLEKFSNIHIPVVYINKEQVGNEFIAALDNHLGGRMATQHLVDQGYQRIGIITGPQNWWETQERLAGWLEVVENQGYQDFDSLIVEGDWKPTSGEIGLVTLLKQEPTVDAVFVSNDQMALGVLRAARQLGIKVPQQLGVIGFDDIPEAAFFYPPLSTIRQEPNALGSKAIEIINTLMQASQNDIEIKPYVTLIEPELTIRQSSLGGNRR